MSDQIKRILLIPHIKVQNANALSSPLTIGFPAMTAWLGAMHALQRGINQSGLKNTKFNGLSVISHKFFLKTYKGPGDFNYSIIGAANPLKKDGSRPSFIEEPRCDFEVSLLIDYSGVSKDDESVFLDLVEHHLNSTMKIAGGDILEFAKSQAYKLEDGNDTDLRLLKRKLMPGYAIIERSDLMRSAMGDGQDALDAMLDHLAIHHNCERDNSENVTWDRTRKVPGWIVPIAIGFQGLTELGQATNQRDPQTPHRFAESVITLGEFRWVSRIKTLEEILWRYDVDLEKNLYLCKQNQ